jgi:hypothetical protein
MIFVRVKCVLFAVRAGYLNKIETNFGFKVLPVFSSAIQEITQAGRNAYEFSRNDR